MKPVGSGASNQPVQTDSQDLTTGQANPGAAKTDPADSKVETRTPQDKAKSAAESQIGGNALMAELQRRFGDQKHVQSQPVVQQPQGPAKEDIWFKDADKDVAPRDRDERGEASMMKSMLKADLIGNSHMNYAWNSTAPLSEKQKAETSRALEDAFQDKDFTKWIESDPQRRAKVEAIVRKVSPTDPSIAENAEVNKKVDSFKNWGNYRYQTIIVPGYTPLDQKQAVPGVNDVGKERLVKAKAAFDEGKAPFIMLSGGNVYPRGTQYHEAIEMKKELIRMGVPSDRIIVDAQARHTTTNLRNAGRYMLDHNMSRGLVVTGGGPGSQLGFGQDFYLANPDLSTYNMRCKSELGYEVGSLTDVGPTKWGNSSDIASMPDHKVEVEYRPSPDVKRFNYRDPLDP